MSGDRPESQIGILYELYWASTLFENSDENAIIKLQDGEDVSIEYPTKKIYYQLKWHKKNETESITIKSGLMKSVKRMIMLQDPDAQLIYMVANPKWIKEVKQFNHRNIAFLAVVFKDENTYKENNIKKNYIDISWGEDKINIENYLEYKDEILSSVQEFIDIGYASELIQYLYDGIIDDTSISHRILKSIQLKTAFPLEVNFFDEIKNDKKFMLLTGYLTANYPKLSNSGIKIKDFRANFNKVWNDIVTTQKQTINAKSNLITEAFKQCQNNHLEDFKESFEIINEFEEREKQIYLIRCFLISSRYHNIDIMQFLSTKYQYTEDNYFSGIMESTDQGSYNLHLTIYKQKFINAVNFLFSKINFNQIYDEKLYDLLDRIIHTDKPIEIISMLLNKITTKNDMRIFFLYQKIQEQIRHLRNTFVPVFLLKTTSIDHIRNKNKIDTYKLIATMYNQVRIKNNEKPINIDNLE